MAATPTDLERTPDSDRTSTDSSEPARNSGGVATKGSADAHQSRELVVACIEDFSSKLYYVHKEKQMQLYYNLLKKVMTEKKESMVQSYIDGFVRFFAANDERLTRRLAIDDEERIYQGSSKTVYIPIGRYLREADDDDAKEIVRHLLTISEFLQHSESKMKALKSDPEQIMADLKSGDTKEDKFIAGIFDKVNASKPAEGTDAMTAVTAMLTSGALKDLLTGTQEQAGGLNGKRVITKMSTMLTRLADTMPD